MALFWIFSIFLGLAYIACALPVGEFDLDEYDQQILQKAIKRRVDQGLPAYVEDGHERMYLVAFAETSMKTKDGPTLYNDGNRPGSATNSHSCNQIRNVPAELRNAANMYPSGLGNFYQKYTEAYGIPVLGSSALSNSALQRACYVVRFIMADNYAARNSYYKYYGRFALMGTNEVTTDIPEHTSLGSWWNDRARGLGATLSRPVSTGGEENALCLTNDRYRQEDILLHEFAHGLHILGAKYAIPGFETYLTQVYNSAMAEGLWANTYATTNHIEYFAEGVQSYYEVNAYANPPDGIHGPVDTKEKLRIHDPRLYNLIVDTFKCGNDYIKRCDKDRDAELNQQIRINCQDGGGGVASTDFPPITTQRPISTVQPGTCVDDNINCASWASSGECQNNPGYMLVYCKKSCNQCQDCVDNNTNCSSWAAQGECQANPGYMLINCKKSCNVC